MKSTFARTKLHVIRVLLAALVMLQISVAAPPATGAPITIDALVDTPESINAKLHHDQIDPLFADNHFFILGNFWIHGFQIRGNGGFLTNDTLDVSLDVTHVIPPHGEAAGEPQRIDFSFASADRAPGLYDLGPRGTPVAHGLHVDEVEATLTVEVSDGSLSKDITYYLIIVNTLHTPEPVYPAAILLAPLYLHHRRTGMRKA